MALQTQSIPEYRQRLAALHNEYRGFCEHLMALVPAGLKRSLVQHEALKKMLQEGEVTVLVYVGFSCHYSELNEIIREAKELQSIWHEYVAIEIVPHGTSVELRLIDKSDN